MFDVMRMNNQSMDDLSLEGLSPQVYGVYIWIQPKLFPQQVVETKTGLKWEVLFAFYYCK